MKVKNQIMLAGIAYILFMVVFTSVFLPSFTEKVGDNEMVDAYLVDYRKSISDIETLILNYGEEGRIYMVPFFIMDSIYVMISVTLFFLIIKALVKNQYARYIPLLTGLFDTIENIAVLYTGLTLDMSWLPFARFFATAKAVSLLASIIIIAVGVMQLIRRSVKPQTL